MTQQPTIITERPGPAPAPEPPEPADPQLRDPRLFDNRELSWIEFNARVLELAEQDDLPLLERVRFASIFSSNLDEFFMIRVAGLHDQVDAGLTQPGADGRTPSQVLDRLRARIGELIERQTRCVERDLRPGLADHGIRILTCGETSEAERAALDERFRRQIFPVLTPLAVGLGRPFPYISNLSLSLAVLVRDPQTQTTTTSRRSSRGWRSSIAAASASRGTPTSRSPTRPTTS
jgi:polyphosphate kinase